MDLRHAPRTLLSLGAVNIAGTPVGDQVALWNDLDTIQGDAGLTFDGSTLAVTGNQTLSGSLTSEGAILVDIDSTEAFLVRADGDGGDVFTVDTDSSIVRVNGTQTISSVLSIGTTPAITGTLRLPYAGTIAWRNAGDTGDLSAFDFTGAAGSEILEIGFGDIFRVNLSATDGVGVISDFDVTGDQTLSGFLALGSSPAQGGTIRLPYTGNIQWRNAGDTDDMNVIKFTGAPGSETLQLGFGDVVDVQLAATTVSVLADFVVTGDQTLTGTLGMEPPASLAAEGLVNGDFTIFTGWTDSGQFSQGTGVYSYAEAGGSTGSIIQATASMAIPILANTLYELTYTISNVVQTVRLALERPFVDSSVTLEDPVTIGTKTVRFWSGAQAVNTGFVMSANGGATGDAFDIDDISLKRATETTVTVEGYIQGLQTGGLAGGFRINDDGILMLGQRRKDHSVFAPYDVMIIGPEAGTSSGFDTSGAIVFRAQHHTGAVAHSSDWRIYNEPANNLGVSRYRWANRIDETPYAIKMQLHSDSNRLEINAEPGVQPTTSADTKLLIQNNLNVTDHCNLSIISGSTSGESRIFFGDNVDEDEGVFLFRHVNNDFSWTVDGTANALQLALSDLTLASSMALSWSTDLKLFRDGPWELALRDGSNDNFLYIYATHTDASNFERLALYAGGSGNVTMEAQTQGSGQNDINMTIQPAGGGFLQLGQDTITNTSDVRFRGSDHESFFLFGTKITYRVKRSLSTALTSGATFTFTNVVPANFLVKAIFLRITVEVTGPTTVEVGDGSDPDRWGVFAGLTVGNTTEPSDYTDRVNEAPFYTGTSDTDVVITAVGGNFTAGVITCHVVGELVQALSIT